MDTVVVGDAAATNEEVIVEAEERSLERGSGILESIYSDLCSG